MHAFLIVGDNTEEVDRQIKKTINADSKPPLEFSIDKIEKTREINQFLKLSQPRGTTIIIRGVDEATTASLNAFLKSLEEPNENVTFILTARNEFMVLPTIISRCQVIRALKHKLTITKDEESEVSGFVKAKVGHKLKLIDKLRKREDAIPFVKKLIIFFQKQLTSSKVNLYKTANFLKVSQQTLDALSQNGNVTMQMTNLAVKMEKTTGTKGSNEV